MKTGFAFGENIKTEKIKRRRYYDGDKPGTRSRGLLMPVLLVIAIILILFKVIDLQLVRGNYYRGLADTNRMRAVIIHAPRGIIFDRNGIPLVFNIPGFREIIKDKGQVKIVLLNKEDALKKIAKGQQNIEVDSFRQYPFKDAMAHVLGYIGQISKEEMDSGELSDYLPTDWLGKSGLEKTYESRLRGRDGRQLIEVNALGKIVRSLGKTDPLPGEDITTTIDLKLQQKAYEATSEIKKGAVVASTPNGEILAMVSRPSFDPNLFTLDDTYRPSSTSGYFDLQDILGDQNEQPLLNRVIGGVYPPGSTFKIVTAAAGLEDKIIDSSFKVDDLGILKVGEFSYANWYYTQYGKTEGMVDVVRALARSNDIFFYKLAEKVGVDRLSGMAKEFGLGRRSGVDLGGEVSGLVPDKKWKKEQLDEDWYLGDTFHYGIGQGYLLTTPLQVNDWTEAVANGGILYQPRLYKDQNPMVRNQKFLSGSTTDLIRKGMIESCSKGGGSMAAFRIQSEEFRNKS